MVNAMSRVFLLGVLALPAAACGGSDGGGGFDSKVDSFLGELEQQHLLVCDCWQGTYPSRTACEQARELLPSQRACLHEALTRDQTSTESWLDCVLPLEMNYTQCIYARLQCEGTNDLAASCVTDYNIGRQNCVDLPAATSRALESCG